MFFENVTSAIDDRCFTDVIYLDLAKAFDSVSHKKLILKLMKLGFNGVTLQLIISFLSDRWQCVQVVSLLYFLSPVEYRKEACLVRYYLHYL